jgi:hypothetical protein
MFLEAEKRGGVVRCPAGEGEAEQLGRGLVGNYSVLELDAYVEVSRRQELELGVVELDSDTGGPRV